MQTQSPIIGRARTLLLLSLISTVGAFSVSAAVSTSAPASDMNAVRRCIVTGGSSGIGASICVALGRKGHSVFVTGTSPARSPSLAHGSGVAAPSRLTAACLSRVQGATRRPQSTWQQRSRKWAGAAQQGSATCAAPQTSHASPARRPSSLARAARATCSSRARGSAASAQSRRSPRQTSTPPSRSAARGGAPAPRARRRVTA